MKPCEKCNGCGWVWWFELDQYYGPAIETGVDDTKYPCDQCDDESDESEINEYYDC